jgi:hypothetical protein
MMDQDILFHIITETNTNQADVCLPVYVETPVYKKRYLWSYTCTDACVHTQADTQCVVFLQTFTFKVNELKP